MNRYFLICVLLIENGKQKGIRFTSTFSEFPKYDEIMHAIYDQLDANSINYSEEPILTGISEISDADFNRVNVP